MTIVIGFLLFSLATHQSDTVLAAQLTADHAKCFRLFAKSDSPDGDARLIEQRFEHDYGWNLHVPPSSAANGVRLIEARRCLYADGPVSHVMYRVNGHDVSLFVLDGVSRSANDVVSFGHRSRIWSVGPSTRGARSGQGRRTFVLVWPVTAGDLTAAARYVMEEAK
jgi:anti-sigma factor RsiW